MRLNIPFFCCLMGTSVAFNLKQLFSGSNDLFATTSPSISREIPGGSPIETCMDDEPQLLDVMLVSIDPNPPVPGTNLTVVAAGVLKTDLEDGAYVDIMVRYGFITLVSKRYDLCELLPEVSLECPVKSGFLKLTRSVEIPEEVPPGLYTVLAKAYTANDELLTCLTADVVIE